MGRVQLRKTEQIKKARKKNFDYLYKHLSMYGDLIMPTWITGADVCWFAFPITVNRGRDRGELLRHLEKNGIETRPLFAGNIIRHPMMKYVHEWRAMGTLEGANIITSQSFWLSCHPSLTMKDLRYINNVFYDFFT